MPCQKYIRAARVDAGPEGCGAMAKAESKAGTEGPETPDKAAPLEVRLFQDGPPPMLLDLEGADFGALSNEIQGELQADPVSLALDDLLPDAAGEVVVLAGDDLPVNLLASEPVVDTGIAPAHVTAGGMEVTGLHYYSFESGVTVYSPVDLLILNDPGAG